MSAFTDDRNPDTPDEIWLLEHPPVYTLGLNADRAHVLAPGDIPIVQVDRGGQVTYHGPGQLIVYTLIDLKRARLGIRGLGTDHNYSADIQYSFKRNHKCHFDRIADHHEWRCVNFPGYFR